MSLKGGSRWQDMVVPGAVPMSWLAYAAEKGLPLDQIIHQVGLSAEQAASFSAGVPLIKFQRLMMAVHEHTGDDGIGFEVGWRMPPTTYGSMGYALLTSATLRDALEVCLRFWHLIGRGIGLDVTFHDGQGIFSFFLQFPADGALRRLTFESIMTTVYRSIVLLVPEAAAQAEVWFDYPEPEYGMRLRERIPGVRFDMPLMQGRFPIALLDMPLPMASAAGQQAAIQQCELEERTLNLQGQLTGRVQKELGFRAAGYPMLEQVATLLSMTARTLRRKLQEESTSYSVLLDAARLRDAVLLLENPALDIVQVAEYLGYNDAANFTRAFRKWTGTTPSVYRLQALSANSRNTI